MKNELLWLVWFAVAVLAALVEVLTPSFGFVFASAAALVSLVLALLGVSLFVQMVSFAVVLLLLLLLLRPYLQRKFGMPGNLPSRAELLVGQRGIVSERIDVSRGMGRVNVGGEDWAAKSTEVLEQGVEVFVEGIDGIRLVVALYKN